MKATLKIKDKEIEVEITEEELKKFEEKKPRKRWRAEKGEDYWYISEYNSVKLAVDARWDDDNCHYTIGNYFKTKEEAEFHKNELIYTQMLKDYIYEHDDVKLDWRDDTQRKYFLYYDFCSKKIDYFYSCVYKFQGTIYASNEQVLEDAIKFIGEENVKKYILKVEE